MVGLIAQAAGINLDKINYVAYLGGGAAQASILAGNVTAGISGYGEFEAQIKAGKLRALAISSPHRIPGIDVPTLKEQGVDVELFNWRAIFAPPGITEDAEDGTHQRGGENGLDPSMGRNLKKERLDRQVLGRRPIQKFP